jgi:hypothetical protein
MLAQLPSIRSGVEAAIYESQSRRFPFHQKFKRLLVDPLERIDTPVVFVFDALDNCDVAGHRTLLQLLLKHLPSIPLVKVMITSRPLASIKDLLAPSPLVTGHDIQLYSICGNSPNDNITIYVNQHYNLRYLTQKQRADLAIRSNGLFIWAATACRLFQNNRQHDVLVELLLDPEFANDMDALYLGILKKALVDPGAHQNFMGVLQVIIAAVEPISISTIEIYLPHNRLVDAFVQDLASVVKDGDPYRPIHVIHPSFREFLSQSSRANGFLVEPFPSHALLARACLHYNIAKHLEVRRNLPAGNYKARDINLKPVPLRL